LGEVALPASAGEAFAYSGDQSGMGVRRAIVVGRRYGAESAIIAIDSFFLKHEMIISNVGVSGIAFEEEEVLKDEEAIKAIEVLDKRINELCYLNNGITS